MIKTPLINVMTAAALKAARGLKRDYGEVANLQVSRKGPGDFVSAADKKAEKVLFEELSKARPGYGFVMEESGRVEGADRTHVWHVDPLDGTKNFLHSVPHYAISIGLERDGEVVAGCIFNPANDEMFVAEKGKGAYMNNQRLRVAQRRELADALVCCGIPHMGRGGFEVFRREIDLIMPKVSGIRRFGAAALDLAYVAAGRCDAFWERGLSSWDLAAGIVIVREAGGFITDVNDSPDMMKTGSVLAGNPDMHQLILAIIKQAAK